MDSVARERISFNARVETSFSPAQDLVRNDKSLEMMENLEASPKIASSQTTRWPLEWVSITREGFSITRGIRHGWTPAGRMDTASPILPRGFMGFGQVP